MQLGASFSGTAIDNSMLGACHAWANPLTAHYGLTHGLAIGILLPHVIRFNAPAVGPLYEELADLAGLSDGKPGEAVARRIVDFMRAAELPLTLRDTGIAGPIPPLLAGGA